MRNQHAGMLAGCLLIGFESISKVHFYVMVYCSLLGNSDFIICANYRLLWCRLKGDCEGLGTMWRRQVLLVLLYFQPVTSRGHRYLNAALTKNI